MQATVEELRREIAETDSKINATVRTQVYERNGDQAVSLQRELTQLQSQLDVEANRKHQRRKELAKMESSVELEAQNEQSLRQELRRHKNRRSALKLKTSCCIYRR
jgi:hypothetical protein